MRYLRALVLLAVVGLQGCRQERDSRQATIVRLGYVPYSSSLPAFAAREWGLDTLAGLTLELTRFETSNEAIAALVNGNVDGLMGIGLGSLLAVEHRTPGLFRMIWYAVETSLRSVNAILVRTTSPLARIEDLRGRRVGTFAGATQVLNLEAIARRVFGDPQAFRVEQVTPTAQLQVLESGDIAALFTIEPYVTIALQRGLARVLVDNPRVKYILDPFPAGGGVLSSAYVRDHDSVATRLVHLFDEAIRRIRTDEAAAKRILPKYTSIDSALAPLSRLYDWWTSREAQVGRLQEVSDQLEQGRILEGHVDVTRVVLGPR